MPTNPTYPGVYIEEIPSGVHTITGVATSITAFVGRAWKGKTDHPVTITSFADYQRKFGGLWRKSTMSYAVQQFFTNGGTEAIIVRVVTNTAKTAAIDLGEGTKLKASSEGSWGLNLVATVDNETKDKTDTKLFNLTILDDPKEKNDSEKIGGSGQQEKFLNVSIDENNPRYIKKVIDQQSTLVRIDTVGGTKAPAPPKKTVKATAGSGHDGADITDTLIVGDADKKTGIYALKDADLFNLLCIPPLTPGESGKDVALATSLTKAAKFCKDHRAFLLVDAPKDWKASDAYDTAKVGAYSAITRENTAMYYPRLKMADPLQDGSLEYFAPCGVVAGLMSRTDATRGVWKAPAGLEATLSGVMELGVVLTDEENGKINPLGVNCFRTFPGIGTVSWGARTLAGQDILASEWKYVPVRRLALFLEESLFRGTKWVVFEPNDEPLWAKIRLNVGAFMMRLFKQGAFQGTTPDKAFYVRCDSETTTQADINLGIVNTEVGFAPLKPAEFVIIKIQQMAGEL